MEFKSRIRLDLDACLDSLITCTDPTERKMSVEKTKMYVTQLLHRDEEADMQQSINECTEILATEWVEDKLWIIANECERYMNPPLSSERRLMNRIGPYHLHEVRRTLQPQRKHDLVPGEYKISESKLKRMMKRAVYDKRWDDIIEEAIVYVPDLFTK